MCHSSAKKKLTKGKFKNIVSYMIGLRMFDGLVFLFVIYLPLLDSDASALTVRPQHLHKFFSEDNL